MGGGGGVASASVGVTPIHLGISVLYAAYIVRCFVVCF